jgi:pimeloyl-ACP methyl ester carboxylesterase
MSDGLDPVSEYWLDAWQRSILTLDVLRQRGNIYFEHKEEAAPHVLDFPVELVCDGRTLPRPVNYALVRVIPPKGTVIDPAKPPFVVVDPRAGHGPGIGGMKQSSEIGVALAAGHECYFIGFLPEPMPGQTIEDVCQAEARFIEEVAARHPDAEGKPVVIANCQAGWQTMIMAALHPDLTGPIILAGSPLSYWAGVRGKNPMRYLGGLLGGTWLTALAGDLGAGKFDGANLVANFESLNPANTWWTKPYNVYANVDTEGPRFLDFETWWGAPVVLNACEMQWIADNLFVGNKLAPGALRTSDGARIDLRNIKSPIVVFCSWGDNITPPQQALGWIADLYDDEKEIVANGQTIVYTLHQTIGHLGIFVSGKVASREHAEFASCMGMVELMPPGLYEAVITEVAPDAANKELIEGRYIFRLERRTLADIRAFGDNAPEDDLRFAAAARLSEVNKALYNTFLRPAVTPFVTPETAETTLRLHPNRLRFALFSDQNPLMAMAAALAPQVREDRRPAAADNPLLALEKTVSSMITANLENYAALRDAWTEWLFLTTYGSPVLQAALGLEPSAAETGRRIERDLVREADEAQVKAQLEDRFEHGAPIDACIRALIYVRLPEAADERGFNLARRLRAAQPEEGRRSAADLKQAVKDQFLLVTYDAERAIQALPQLLPPEPQKRQALWASVQEVVAAPGPLSAEGRRRLNYVETLFGVKGAKPSKEETQHG